METSNNYWEEYVGQSVEGFSTMTYTSLSGEYVTVPIESNVDKQVSEIYRENGRRTKIKIHK